MVISFHCFFTRKSEDGYWMVSDGYLDGYWMAVGWLFGLLVDGLLDGYVDG